MSEREIKKFDYGENFQKKVIVNLLFDDDFLSNNYKIIEPEYFDTYKYHWTISTILEYYEKYAKAPSYESLIIYLKSDNTLEEPMKESLVVFFATIFHDKKNRNKWLEDFEHVQEHTHQFCWEQNMINALHESSRLAKSGEYQDILGVIEKANNDGNEVKRAIDYDDVEERAEEEFREGLMPLFCDALNKRIGGGIGKGEFIALVGGMGSGKSLLASNFGVGARKMGQVAVLYSLELSANYIRHRTDVILTRTPAEELEAMKKRDKKEYAQYIRKHLKDLDPNGKLMIQYMPTGSTVNDIKADLKWLKAQGHDIGLVIIDYLDKMNPISGKGGKQGWEVFEDITTECRDFLCREMGVAGIGMVQGNTTSLEEKQITASSTSGGARRLHPADIVLGYARPPAQKNSGRANMTIIKNRFGKDALTMPVETDYNVGMINVLDEEFYHTEESDDNNKEKGGYKEQLRRNLQERETRNEMAKVNLETTE